jgi:HlyD family secretion protein
MKRTLTVLVVVMAVILAGWWGYTRYVAGQASASGDTAGQPGAEETPVAEQENVIWASGKLVPAQWAGLSPAQGGTISAIHVNEGDTVAPGALLLEVDNRVLKAQVDVAAAGVAEAQAALDKVLAGATEADLAAARAEFAAAQGSVAQAQAGVEQALAAVTAAESQVAIVQAQYNELAGRPSPAETLAAQRQVDLAQAAVKQAQIAYDFVRGDPNIAARPEALALEQATVSLESARAAYDAAAQGATSEQLAVAQAQIDAARIQVDVARGQVPAAEANVQAAGAQLARAQAGLDRLQTGATAEDRGLAEARLQTAQAGLATAQAQLAQTQIVAPFSGQIGTVLARPGELAAPGQPVLMLGDTAGMHVETTDLRETDVTRLEEGMQVEVTFDALPGRTFQGTVARIAPMSSSAQGSTNYTVTVDVPQLDPGLRWGMTAFVNIQAE